MITLFGNGVKTNKVEVHGMLWLFDGMVDADLIAKREAILLLQELMKSNGWLPYNECVERLERWRVG